MDVEKDDRQGAGVTEEYRVRQRRPSKGSNQNKTKKNKPQ